ncbi:MAG: hypothetical protein KBD78_05175 [Oligoflexales bacterium]|nr:hypothetical protein [Oligoflexales bacterium]
MKLVNKNGILVLKTKKPRTFGTKLLTITTALAFISQAYSQTMPENNSKSSVPSQEKQGSGEQRLGAFLEYLEYEQRVYSRERRTELIEGTKLDTAVRYQFTPETYGRLRLDIDPVEIHTENKVSKLELSAQHIYKDFVFGIDFDIKTNDGDKGGTSFGVDEDSEGTFIAYKALPSLTAVLYPYNFDGEVGEEFYTWDVTRIYYYKEAKYSVPNPPNENDDLLLEKTIPGLVIYWSPFEAFEIYAGIGAASYLYPSNESYTEQSQLLFGSWEYRQDLGQKYGFNIKSDYFDFDVKHVSHNKSAETGSLLAAATSANATLKMGGAYINVEYGVSKAGENAFDLNNRRDSFRSLSPFNPVFADVLNESQDWLGETDSAWMLKTGMDFGVAEPFISYKSLGENFIFHEPESAHRLRTNDKIESHGGLKIVGFGTVFDHGAYKVTPELEFMNAKNKVFGRSGDVWQSESLRDYRKTNYLVTLKVDYYFDAENVDK